MPSKEELTILINAKDEASKVLKQVNNQVGGFTDNIGNKASAALKQFQTSLNVAGTVAAAGAGVFIKSGLDVAISFEKQLSSIKALTGATDEQIKSISNLSKKLGYDTKFSALESAQAFEELLKAGVSLEESMNGGVAGALDLAAAGELEVVDAAEIASTALNAFRKDNLKVSDAANILAGAANASATSVGEMKYGLSMVSAVASGLGLNFKDTNTALAVFAQNGLKGSDAGTSLKTMLLNLQPSTEKAAKLFDKFGLTIAGQKNAFFDAEGRIRSMSEIAQVLKDKFSKLNDQQRQMVFEELFGTDAIRAANILYKEGADGINGMWKAMSSVSAAEVAKERTNNLAGAIDRFKGTVESIKISLFTSSLKGLANVVDAVGNSLEKINWEQVGESVERVVMSMIQNLSAFQKDVVNPLIQAIKNFWNSGNDAKGTIVAIAAALGLWANPIATIITGFGLLILNWKKVKEYVFEGVDQINNTFKRITGIDIFKNISEMGKSSIGNFFSSLKSLVHALGSAFDTLKPAIVAVVSIISVHFAQTLNTLALLLKTVAGVIEEVSAAIKRNFKNIGEILTALLNHDGEGFKNGMINLFQSMANGVISILNVLLGSVTGVLEQLSGGKIKLDWKLNLIGDAAKEMGNEVGNATRTVEEGMRKAEDATKRMEGAINSLSDSMQGLGGKAIDVGEAQKRAVEAQNIYNNAVEQFGKNSPQAVEAYNSMFRAQDNLTKASNDYQNTIKSMEIELSNLTAINRPLNEQERVRVGQLLESANRAREAAGMNNVQRDSLQGVINKVNELLHKPEEKNFVANINTTSTQTLWQRLQNWWGTAQSYLNQNPLVHNIIQHVKQVVANSPILSGVASFFGGGRAIGGTTARAGSYMVGEYGPEIVNLPAGARVSTSLETQQTLKNNNSGGMNIGNINISIDANGLNLESATDKRNFANSIVAEMIQAINLRTRPE